MNIFPKLKKGSWIKINLNDESKKANVDLSEPIFCTKFIKKLNKSKNADYSFGGFLEDRTFLWRNHPNESADSLIHLGIDYSVPVGTEICLPIKGEVFHIMKDPQNSIGWGGRIIFKLENGTYLLYGHLNQNISLQIGQICDKKTIVGKVGDIKENGNWWPHLHAQLMTQDLIDNYLGKIEELDGYLSKKDKNLPYILDPSHLIRI